MIRLTGLKARAWRGRCILEGDFGDRCFVWVWWWVAVRVNGYVCLVALPWSYDMHKNDV